MYKEMNDYINNLSEGELAMLCNEIYDWNITGKLSQDSNLYRLSICFPCPDIKYVVVCKEKVKQKLMDFEKFIQVECKARKLDHRTALTKMPASASHVATGS